MTDSETNLEKVHESHLGGGDGSVLIVDLFLMENKSPFKTIKSSLPRNGDVPDMESRRDRSDALTHQAEDDRKQPALVSLNQCKEGTTPRVEEADLGLAKGFGMNYHHASESIDSTAKWSDHVGGVVNLVAKAKEERFLVIEEKLLSVVALHLSEKDLMNDKSMLTEPRNRTYNSCKDCKVVDERKSSTRLATVASTKSRSNMIEFDQPIRN
ncbi:hypothetical protein T02_14592 [Trichinella nativa]|uniref:Uncharacterized protein n=1 Tax=Trichinella nativa TaxID=6335 RepID=A0A0V1L9X1_9BILA|nr:hypothetical protein T02_14592 [Trichinella nativa]